MKTSKRIVQALAGDKKPTPSTASSPGGAERPDIVSKRARKKQNISPGTLQHLTRLATGFEDALARCLNDLDVEAVHDVRTGSRRLQAMVETIKRESGRSVRLLDQPARAWLSQLKQIRGAAGVVRDLDVHRKLLKEWVEETFPQKTEEPEALRDEAAKLDEWLKDRRENMAQGLLRQIHKRQPRLQERKLALLAALGRATVAERPAAMLALNDFVRSSDRMPVLDATNLHDFRKLVKKARYVAESGAEDPHAKAVAKALKCIQDEIGKWHDWLCLSQEASTALTPRDGGLAALFDEQCKRYYAQALKTTYSMRSRLIGEWIANGGKPAKAAPADPKPPQPGEDAA